MLVIQGAGLVQSQVYFGIVSTKKLARPNRRLISALALTMPLRGRKPLSLTKSEVMAST